MIIISRAIFCHLNGPSLFCFVFASGQYNTIELHPYQVFAQHWKTAPHPGQGSALLQQPIALEWGSPIQLLTGLMLLDFSDQTGTGISTLRMSDIGLKYIDNDMRYLGKKYRYR